MKIITLIENTEGNAGCISAHGLSFYAEVNGHKLLLDLGPSADTLENAHTLGIDLTKAEFVILSHGHYDHSGGIIPFIRMGCKAKIYMQSAACGDFYADDGPDAPGERYRYIGIDKQIPGNEGVVLLDGDHNVCEGVELFTVKRRTHELPFTNKRLLMKSGDELVRDEFKHEQFLVLKENGMSVLMGGCAHNGILSIMDSYTEKYGNPPDVVISGFHLMKKTPYRDDQIKEIEDIASRLKEYPTRFYTCHCTGVEAYDIMKKIMGEKVAYVHSGEEVFL